MAKKKSKKSGGITLQPLGDRVVVRREQTEETTAGGIVLPDSAQGKPARGVVVSIGDGALLSSGERSTMQVKECDRVLFTSYAGEEFQVGDEELLLMREDDIMCTLVD